MYKFTANVPLDTAGYRWSNEGTDYTPEDNDDYDENITLEANSKMAWWYQALGTGQVDYDQTYDPFVMEPALFRIFAALEPTEKAILNFANRYGDIAPSQNLYEGEDGFSFSEWKAEIKQFHEWIHRADRLVAARDARPTKGKALQATRDLVEELLGSVQVFLWPVPSAWYHHAILLFASSVMFSS